MEEQKLDTVIKHLSEIKWALFSITFLLLGIGAMLYRALPHP